MIFIDHSALKGMHSFLSPSNYHWINYSEDKLVTVYKNRKQAEIGTQLHNLAAELIRMGVKLPRTTQTLNSYVNDAIGHRMTPEQVLFYSENAFGTADAIAFRNNLLRIHDYKSGVEKSSMRQLEVYAALFCLEYQYKPEDIAMELRIYQNDSVEVLIPDPAQIRKIMNTIVEFDKKIAYLKREGLS